MKVLAVGGTGFIGGRVIPLLLKRGFDVAVLHRAGSHAKLPGAARRIHGDRNSLDEVRDEVWRFAPDVVLDVILYTEDQARKLIELFRGHAGRLVVLSSADVYRNYDGLRRKSTAPPDGVPLSERAPLRESRYPYRGSVGSFEYANDYDKILVEQVVLGEPALPATVLRLPAVYGPGDPQHRIRPYVERMLSGEREILLERKQATWRWTRGYVDNVASAIALAVADDRAGSRIYNVGDEPVLTEREWVERIGGAAGWSGKVVTVPRNEFPEAMKQPLDWRYELWTDTSRIRDELGYTEMIPLDVALERTVAWEISTPRG